MLIERDIKKDIEKRLLTDRAIVIFGARQVGKTTLLHALLDSRDDVMWLNGDNPETLALFDQVTAQKFESIAQGKRILVIDEAQRIENVGLKLKIIHDALKSKIQIIATGSSSFDLANKINEPLTGRKWTFEMFPLSFGEMSAKSSWFEERQNLENRLLFGYYPAVVTHPGDERVLLNELVNDNLYKDIYKWEEIRRPVEFDLLVKALAHQIGSQVSVNELSRLCGIDNKTVNRYLRLLEQSFVIFRLGSFSSNLRTELKSSDKYYFYDVGVRNALLGAFEPTELRNDIGHLFENFIMAELAKKYMPTAVGSFAYFWRTKQQQEVDFVLQRGNAITAYEIKWSPQAKGKISNTFVNAYQPNNTRIIHRDNFHEILLDLA
jgi:predicted AAA+ superfamily ATPase